jgi:MscS family membrane protein
MNWINQIFLGLPMHLWLRFGIILIIATLLNKYFASVITKILFSTFKKYAEEKYLQKFKSLLVKPMQGILVTLLSFIAFNQIDVILEKIILFRRKKGAAGVLEFNAMELVDRLFFLCFIFYLCLFITRIITFIFYILVDKARIENDKEKQQLLPLLRDIISVLIWALGFLTVLGVVFLVNVPTLIAGLGFGGVAVAFAAKESLENLLASLMIMVDKPFTIGDHIKVSGIEGKAEKIGFRSTRIKTFDQTVVSVPNKNLIGTSLENLSLRKLQRVKFKVNAPLGLSEHQIQAIINKIDVLIKENTYTNDDVKVHLDGFVDGAEIVIVYFITLPAPIPTETIKQDINFAIYNIMYELGGGFAIPTSISISGNDVVQPKEESNQDL